MAALAFGHCSILMQLVIKTLSRIVICSVIGLTQVHVHVYNYTVKNILACVCDIWYIAVSNIALTSITGSFAHE